MARSARRGGSPRRRLRIVVFAGPSGTTTAQLVTTTTAATRATIDDRAAAEPVGPGVWVASESGQAVTLATLEPPSTRTVRLSGPAHNIAVTGEGTAVATLPARGRVAFVRDGAAREIDLDGEPP